MKGKKLRETTLDGRISKRETSLGAKLPFENSTNGLSMQCGILTCPESHNRGLFVLAIGPQLTVTGDNDAKIVVD